eukprot:3996616-Lingulodinium_polyedra.AAC.1
MDEAARARYQPGPRVFPAANGDDDDKCNAKAATGGGEAAASMEAGCATRRHTLWWTAVRA